MHAHQQRRHRSREGGTHAWTLDAALVASVIAGEAGLEANRNDHAARNELPRLLDLLAATLPVSHRTDSDALRLELGISTK
jgi:hypothetical protein